MEPARARRPALARRTVRATFRPSTDRADYPFRNRIRTRFAETDAMGVIHHGAYAPFLEEARVAMLRAAGLPYEEIRQQGIELIVLELLIDYRRPLRFDEIVDVHVRVGEIARASFQLGYLLTVDQEVRSTGVTVHGAVDVSGRPVRLPLPLVTVLEESRTSGTGTAQVVGGD
jgi:acyl-CoA thioester hydrolase